MLRQEGTRRDSCASSASARGRVQRCAGRGRAGWGIDEAEEVRRLGRSRWGKGALSTGVGREGKGNACWSRRGGCAATRDRRRVETEEPHRGAGGSLSFFSIVESMWWALRGYRGGYTRGG
jgi:hypothetical protein